MNNPQHIKVDALGRPTSAYKDGNPVDLKRLGDQRIERFSEVLHDETHQKFYVQFRVSAPEGLRGTLLGEGLHYSATGHEPAFKGFVNVPEAGKQVACLFDTYQAAVDAEQAVLHYLMIQGEM